MTVGETGRKIYPASISLELIGGEWKARFELTSPLPNSSKKKLQLVGWHESSTLPEYSQLLEVANQHLNVGSFALSKNESDNWVDIHLAQLHNALEHAYQMGVESANTRKYG